MITKDTKLKELATTKENLLVLEKFDIRGLDNDLIFKTIGDKTLVEISKFKNINITLLIEALTGENTNYESDVTLVKKDFDKNNTTVSALLPCPLRIPLTEILTNAFGDKGYNLDFKSASGGNGWIKDIVNNAKTSKELSDIFVFVGFEIFYDKEFISKFKSKGIFQNYLKNDINKDFKNENFNMLDPDYNVISAVPIVFGINKEILGDRKVPTTLLDLLDPIYENSISLPISDANVYFAVCLNIYKEYGDDGLEKFIRNIKCSLHPSQVIKSVGKKDAPAISLMPSFFAMNGQKNSKLDIVWPIDGAIVSPIMFIAKAESHDKVKPVFDLITSEKISTKYSHDAFFPSVMPNIDNKLENNFFRWLGWDYIEKQDMRKLYLKMEKLAKDAGL